MSALTARDARRVLDAAAELGAITDEQVLRASTARLAFDLFDSDRSGWVQIDRRSGRLSGAHWPRPVGHLLAALPRDLSLVPLVDPLEMSATTDALRISDIWSRRQWHATQIWADFYGPNGGEHQLASAICRRDGVLEALSFVREDRDFTAREVAIVTEFARHVRAAAGRILPPAGLGLTRRQSQVLRALETGATVRQAAFGLGVSEKTFENHLQEAYRRLGVNNRIAALRALRGDAAEDSAETPPSSL